MEERARLRPEVVLARNPRVELFEVDDVVLGLGRSGLFSVEDVDRDGLRAVLALIDGRRSAGEVAAALGAIYEVDDVLALLEQLEGVVLRRVAPEGDGTAARRWTDRSLVVVGDGLLARRILLDLEQNGAQVRLLPGPGDGEGARANDGRARLFATSGPDEVGEGAAASFDDLKASLAGSALVVCALEGVRGQAFLRVNEACLEVGIPSLFVGIEGEDAVLGPLVLPWRSPCFACSRLSTTLKSHFDGEAAAILPLLPFGRLTDHAPTWWVERLVFEVRCEVEAALGGLAYPARLGYLLALSPRGGAKVTKFEAVTVCPACRGHHRGGVGGATSGPPLPVPREPAIVCDETGGVRSVDPEEANLRAQRAIERLGVDLRCLPLDGDAPEAFAALACPFYRTDATPQFSRDAEVALIRSADACYGKGTTDLQARCSATFEWFERNLAEWRGDRDLVRATYEEVRDRAVDVPFMASGVLPGLERRGRRPFDAREPMDWVWGECLRTRRPILVPATTVFLSDTLFLGSTLELPRSGSSGLSAGCSIADATLQGLLEIVERDATNTAIRNGSVHPVIELSDVTEPAAKALIERIQAAGYAAHMRDITSALGVPTIEVYLVRDGAYENHFAGGYGAHLDPAIAMRRALTEAAQCLFGVASSGVDLLLGETSFFDVYPHRRQVFERKGPPNPASLAMGIPTSRSVWDQVDEVVARIAAAVPRADICAVDLSLPSLQGVHVVRSLVTGAFDEVQRVPFHVPLRCRLIPLEEMFLGPVAL